MNRIVDVLQSTDDGSVAGLVELPAKAGHYLNLISMIIHPFRRDWSSLQALQAETQETCLKSLLSRLQQLVSCLEPLITDVAQRDRAQQLKEPALFLTRLLHFILSFPEAWTPSLRNLGDPFVSTILRLTQLFGAGPLTDVVAFPFLLDTVFYILDGTYKSF